MHCAIHALRAIRTCTEHKHASSKTETYEQLNAVSVATTITAAAASEDLQSSETANL